MLAQTLDELDQALASDVASDVASEASDSSSLSSLAQEAQRQSAAMAQARQQQAGTPLADSPISSSEPSLMSATELPQNATIVGSGKVTGSLIRVNRLEANDWGKLPPKLAKDLVEGSRESVSSEYRSQVETYFRVIAERARKKK